MAISTIDLATPSGLKLYSNTDLAEVKAGITSASTKIHFIEIDNQNGAEVFLKLWNLAVGNVTVGTTAVTSVIVVPASTVLPLPFPKGWTFGTGLTVACVLNAVESDTTDPGATEVIVSVMYA